VIIVSDRHWRTYKNDFIILIFYDWIDIRIKTFVFLAKGVEHGRLVRQYHEILKYAYASFYCSGFVIMWYHITFTLQWHNQQIYLVLMYGRSTIVNHLAHLIEIIVHAEWSKCDYSNQTDSLLDMEKQPKQTSCNITITGKLLFSNVFLRDPSGKHFVIHVSCTKAPT
jgi:hypothetical protein